MNFVPCSLEGSANALSVRLSKDIAFALPQPRLERYRPYRGHGGLLLGLRPEHIVEQRAQTGPYQQTFDITLEVTEPMGMETLVHFRVNGTDVCGRVSPAAHAESGRTIKLMADLDQMHLIDSNSGQVL
jgi:multiple sugar transport system ATP-binding protein